MSSPLWGVTFGSGDEGAFGSVSYGEPSGSPFPRSWLPWILWGALAYFIAIAREK